MPRILDSFRNMNRIPLRQVKHLFHLFLCSEQSALTLIGPPTEQPFASQRSAQ